MDKARRGKALCMLRRRHYTHSWWSCNKGCFCSPANWL